LTSILLTPDILVTPAGAAAHGVLIEAGRIAAVGPPDALCIRAGMERRLAGVLVPAPADAHLHPVALAAASMHVDLRAARSLGEVLAAIANRAGEAPQSTAVAAIGLDDERLAEGRMPLRSDLDSAAPGRAILVHRVCGHVASASTAALDLAGIGPATPDPPGGSIARGSDGPNGILRETAVEIVASALAARLPAPGPAEILAALRDLLGRGITLVTGMVSTGVGGWCGGSDELTPLLEVAGDLPIDVDVLVMTPDPDDLRRAAARIAAAGGRLRFLGWKGFADGSLGARTALLREPYSDAPGVRGTDRLDPRTPALALAALESGGSVAVHAIGDAAAGRVLDLFETLAVGGVAGTRLRLEHASVLSEHDITRIGRLGAIASVQPAFLASDSIWLARRLGPGRLASAYPFRLLADAGIPMAGGSDAPVEIPDPWSGMRAARTRHGLDGRPGLSPGEALSLFLDGPRLAAGRSPALAPGSPADLVLLDRDPIEGDQATIAVRGVWKDGERVV
jgi:predicted amidohydrolase YtcJ